MEHEGLGENDRDPWPLFIVFKALIQWHEATGDERIVPALHRCALSIGKLLHEKPLGQIGRNVEMPNYTQATYDSRELALSRMQAEAEREGAEGIVGAQVHENSHGWGSHVIEYFAIGTAIMPISENHSIPSPTLVLPLTD